MHSLSTAQSLTGFWQSPKEEVGRVRISRNRIARQHFDGEVAAAPPHLFRARSTYARRSPGEPFAVTPIRGCNGVMDLGDKRIMEYRITAREIAEDIAREINSDSGEGSFSRCIRGQRSRAHRNGAHRCAPPPRRIQSQARRGSPILSGTHQESHVHYRLERRAARMLAWKNPGSTIPSPWASARSVARIHQARRCRLQILRRHPGRRKSRALRPVPERTPHVATRNPKWTQQGSKGTLHRARPSVAQHSCLPRGTRACVA